MFRSINTLNKKRKPEINSAVTIITATAMPSLEMFFILFIEQQDHTVFEISLL
jgi:hypothetical protein